MAQKRLKAWAKQSPMGNTSWRVLNHRSMANFNTLPTGFGRQHLKQIKTHLEGSSLAPFSTEVTCVLLPLLQAVVLSCTCFSCRLWTLLILFKKSLILSAILSIEILWFLENSKPFLKTTTFWGEWYTSRFHKRTHRVLDSSRLSLTLKKSLFRESLVPRVRSTSIESIPSNRSAST